MKNLTRRLVCLGLAGGLGFASVSTMAAPAPHADPLQASFEGAPPGTVERLTAAELEATKGEWLPAFVFGVVGVDLALSAYFWGVYVQDYASTSGGCLSCTSGRVNLP